MAKWDLSKPIPTKLRFKPDVKLDTSQITDRRGSPPLRRENLNDVSYYQSAKRSSGATWGNPSPMKKKELQANPLAGGPKKRKK